MRDDRRRRDPEHRRRQAAQGVLDSNNRTRPMVIDEYRGEKAVCRGRVACHSACSPRERLEIGSGSNAL
jgi:hypothetical protein